MEIGIGVDAHKEELAVAAVDTLGRVLAEATFANERAGHAALVQWVGQQGSRRCVGIEGGGN